MNTQQISSIIRQIAAMAAIVMGALTSALSGIKLPPAASVGLMVAGTVVIGIEHYLSDPSTGNNVSSQASIPRAGPSVLPGPSTPVVAQSPTPTVSGAPGPTSAVGSPPLIAPTPLITQPGVTLPQ